MALVKVYDETSTSWITLNIDDSLSSKIEDLESTGCDIHFERSVPMSAITIINQDINFCFDEVAIQEARINCEAGVKAVEGMLSRFDKPQVQRIFYDMLKSR